MMPPYVNVVAGSVEIVPAPVKAIPRLAARVKVAVVRSVPPPKTIFPGLAAPGALPRPASAAIATAPALMVVTPEYVLAALKTTVPAPLLVNPPAPLMTPLIVSVVPALLTVTVRVAANVTAKLIVFAPAALLSARPPAPIVIALLPSVYPLPLTVMVLKVALLRVLFVTRFAAPAGNTRFSAPVPEGATPPAQLLPTPQLAFCAPVHVNVCATPGDTNPPSASRIRRACERVPIGARMPARHVPVGEWRDVILRE